VDTGWHAPPRRRIVSAAMSAALIRRCLLVLAAGSFVTGCGGSGGAVAPRTLAASTSHDLSYTLRVTQVGKQQCVTASYRTALPKGQPILQGSHLCGPAAQPGHVVLVQAHASPESLLTDVATSCTPVTGGSSHHALHRLVSRCTTGKPVFRVITLPALSRVVIVGVPRVPVINFSRHRCRTGICITPLA
jgi:hypothetical protein